MTGPWGGKLFFLAEGPLQRQLYKAVDTGGHSWFFLYHGSGEGRFAHKLRAVYIPGPAACEEARRRYDTQAIESLEDARIDSRDAKAPVALYDAHFEYHSVKGDPELDGRVRALLLRNVLPEFPDAAGAAPGAYFWDWDVYGEPAASATLPYDEVHLRVKERRPDGAVLVLSVDRGGTSRASSGRKGSRPRPVDTPPAGR